MYNVYYVYIVQSQIMNCIHYTVYSIQCTLYSVQTVCTPLLVFTEWRGYG